MKAWEWKVRPATNENIAPVIVYIILLGVTHNFGDLGIHFHDQARIPCLTWGVQFLIGKALSDDPRWGIINTIVENEADYILSVFVANCTYIGQKFNIRGKTIKKIIFDKIWENGEIGPWDKKGNHVIPFHGKVREN